MKLFTKIFLLGMLVLGLAFSASGYLLLHYSLESSLARESEFALKQYQYDKFTVQSALLSATAVTVSINYGDILQPGGYQAYTIKEPYSEGIFRLEDYQEANLFGALAEELSVPAAFFGQNRSLLYSDIRDLDPSFLDSLTENAHVWQFFPSEKGGSILVGSILRRESILVGVTSDGGSLQPPASASDGNPALGQSVYFVTQWDISKTLAQQDTLRQYFLQCYLAAMAAGMVLLIILSAFLTGPLNKMSKAARRIAEGNYGDRLSLKSQDEIGELADSFNQMAGAVEEKIGELARAAREKEDFVANFAHELKTPLTSIIGYADTIYQKELTREEIRRASWHIWNEGMRLEALSGKLMDLAVLGRQDFPLTELPAGELLQDVADGLAPLLHGKNINFCLQAEPAYVLADYDLLKTLLNNLADNAIKAGATEIDILGETVILAETDSPGKTQAKALTETDPPGKPQAKAPMETDPPGKPQAKAPTETDTLGKPQAKAPVETDPPGKTDASVQKYRITVRDNGCGMEQEELSRITEAFYMVDKARSRKQHGAGLGLALADKAARLHGDRLHFESSKGLGTTVSFSLILSPENEKDADATPAIDV